MKLSAERQETIRTIGLQISQVIFVVYYLLSSLVKGAVFTGAAILAYVLLTSDPSTTEFADILRAIQSESFRQFSLVGGFGWVMVKSLIART